MDFRFHFGEAITFPLKSKKKKKLDLVVAACNFSTAEVVVVENQEFKASFGCKVSLRPSWVI